ncbi:hypothetical protein [Gimesia aquarii]|uniref:Uncharacterized protein n=1 Tax=Gimesia aquarii TaxID=2527964 RepID=A0A517WWQ1_9PLAN|nr:hypothetical protein [Gimesia aquarii]QDU09664.1 hypothetical protein V202x_30400 [Gimesia aquarii]
MAKSMKNGSSLVILNPVESSADALLPSKSRDSLVAWFEIYMGLEVGTPETDTFHANKGDLQKFVEYLLDAAGTDHPDQWTKSLTEAFV